MGRLLQLSIPQCCLRSGTDVASESESSEDDPGSDAVDPEEGVEEEGLGYGTDHDFDRLPGYATATHA